MAGLESNRYALIDELADEFAGRWRIGERPTVQEYIDRHPDLADDLREVLGALGEVEQVKDDLGAKVVDSAAALPWDQIGDYRIIRELGKGGMGVVYEAEQVSLGRRVALKLLPNKMLLDHKAKRRFEREARAAAKLHHTNVVQVFGLGEQDGVPYFVMQLIHGLGLDDVLDEPRATYPGRGISAFDTQERGRAGSTVVDHGSVRETERAKGRSRGWRIRGRRPAGRRSSVQRNHHRREALRE
jgi:eukaryotic-like serine/threonine-protein kinase